MLFNSIDYLIFFPIVVSLYFIIPKKIKNFWLLLASYYFYMCWNAKYLLLIFISTVITYFSGILISKANKISKNRTRNKKIIVAISFCLNLFILFYFKYSNFFISIINSISNIVHINFHIPYFDIILPVGISFYTFQALSYTMDVYRGEVKEEKNFFNFALFVSFFPQLVAGPIERSKNLLKQLGVTHKFNFNYFRDGIFLIIWGFFLKLVIADRIAFFVDTVYNNYPNYPGMYLIIATAFFALQIYCDFYGYSTIAVGSAKILGINLTDNFNAPYIATSVSEFWRKWHISLTSWFKDYLYIPLGGNRRGKIRKYFNKIFVFLTSGLWHGANITFVVWGLINGIYQVLEEITLKMRNKIKNYLHINSDTISYKALQLIFVFILICFSWIFFRASSFSDAILIIKSIFTVHNPWILFDGSLYSCGLDAKNFIVLIISIFILFIADLCKYKGIVIRNIIYKQDFWFRCLFVVFVIIIILIFGILGPTFDKNNFIYFQF